MFNVNLTYVITWLLPPSLRGNTIKAWLSCLVTAIQQYYTYLKNYRSTKQYHLSITSQVMYLEHGLNDTFDPVMRAIYIDEYYESTRITVFNKSENLHPPYIYNKSENATKTYLRNKNETNYNYYFVVWVPWLVYIGLFLNNSDKLNKMKALLNKYKCFGTFYLIKPY